MKAVISAVGKDHPGILAFITRETAEHNANILDITQNLTQGLFTMIMVVEFPEDDQSFNKFAEDFERDGREKALEIHVMHEDIFNAMHTI